MSMTGGSYVSPGWRPVSLFPFRCVDCGRRFATVREGEAHWEATHNTGE